MGTLFFSNGEKFSGNFERDVIHGKGKFHTMDDKIIQGIWNNYILIDVI